MSVQIGKSVASLIFYLLVITANTNAFAQEKLQTSNLNLAATSLFSEKLNYYKTLYPEILFINLRGGVETNEDMVALDLILGYAPTSLDYEHPPKLREDLMYVSASRILLMLDTQSPSASLFRAENSFVEPKNICVLTIDPEEVAGDTTRATKHLLHPVLYKLLKIPESMHLLPDEYLAFVIDHEVYHCLRSMYVGPQLMSSKNLWGEYNNFLGDQGADAYALLMHYKTRDQVSNFPQNILRIRGMSLYNADPDHLTYKVLKQVIELQTKKIVTVNEKKIFDMAYNIKKDLSIEYDEYIQYLASAIKAMKLIGVNTEEADKLYTQVKDIKPNPLIVKELVKSSRQCLRELNGK